MENQATLGGEITLAVLYIAFELGRKKWKLGFSDGKVARARLVTITAGDLEGLAEEIEKARKRFDMGESSEIRSCYEAGREGFWLHRAVEQMGIKNQIVDASSIEVKRRQRRAKTDRMDAEKLVRQLIRYWRGERDVWGVVRVPSEEAEQERHLHRDLEVLKKEKAQHRLRIQSLLFTQGIDVKVGAKFLQQLQKLRCWDGAPVPEALKSRLEREYHRLQLAEANIRELRNQQKQQVKATQSGAAIEKVRMLQQLVSLGMQSSWVFVMEMFGWRKFRNRREVAAAVGITPTPYDSGDSKREQGISRAGNRRVRKMAVEIAWAWLRLQPDSKLSRWYKQRFAGGSGRVRRIGIVALARRLVIDLWRYLEFGIVPEGARLKVR